MKRKPKTDQVGDVTEKVKRGVGQHDGPRGLPPHVPTKNTKKKVRMLASYGFTQDEIAMMMDVSESTIQRHYRAELRIGALEADAKVIGNLFKFATSDGPEGARAAMFWTKVRRRWHEVQRVIHGYDPETIKAFVKSVVGMLKRDLPDACPACKTKLKLPEKVAHQMYQLSQEMAAKLPQSEIVPMPRPELASDGIERAE